MKSSKKVLAIIAMVLLLCQMLGISTFAAADPESVEVSLKSNVLSAVEGTVYEVALELDQTSVGGVQGVLAYDKALFTFQSVSMTSTMAAANHLAAADENGMTTAADVITHDAENSKVKFALLADAQNADAEWVTFRFETIAEATSITETAFTLSDVVVSNAAGTAAIASVTTNDLTDVAVSETALTMNGATIRTNGAYDLRYELSLPQAFVESHNVTKVGVVLIPTNLIKDGAEVCNDPTGVSFCKTNSSGVQVVPNIVLLTMDDIKAGQATDGSDYKIYANIAKTATSHMMRMYSLRGFVVIEKDGKQYTVYADNESATIQNGTASRSCQSVAIAVYKDYSSQGATYTEKVKAIIAKETWTAEEYAAVVKANLDAYSSLN